MTEIQKQIDKEINLLVKELIEAYDAKGMRASGRWAKSVETEIVGTKGIIRANDYTQQLEFGRNAGGFPPIDQIEQWVKDKNIVSVDDKINTRTLAFLIARKIAREGYNREGYGGVELVSSVLTPQRVKKVIQGISDVASVEVVNLLRNDFINILKN